jgi:hypothetical protein
MSEPITLHDGAGNTLTVYTRSQAEGLLSGGQWFATEAEAQAAHPRPTGNDRRDCQQRHG